MTNRFELVFGVERLDFIPYNIDTLELEYDFYDNHGGFLWIPSIKEVQIKGVYGADYTWLLNIIKNNKCDNVTFNYYCDEALKFVGRFNYYTCKINEDNCIITAGITSDTITRALLDIIEDKQTLGSHETDVIVPSLSITYTHAVKITDAITHFLTGTGLTLQSTFLTSAFNPMPRAYEPPLDIWAANVNRHDNLFLANGPDGTDEVIETSLGEILDILCLQTLNLRWGVDEVNNKFIIEHISYFENGLSYAGPPVVGLDLTTLDGGKWLRQTNSYELGGLIAPHQEYYKTQIGTDSSYEVNILLTDRCNAGEMKTEEINLNVELSPADVEADGGDNLMLFCCYLNAGNYYIYEQNDAGTWITNIFLLANTRLYYWLWDRWFSELYQVAADPYGWTPTNSTKKLKTQGDLNFLICCTSIDPYKLVKTTLGDAYVGDNYSIRLATGKCSMTLKYEDV